MKNPLSRPGQIIFAPMEGITDDCYRATIEELYPQWDYLCTDFLRVSTQSHYTEKHLLKHFGNKTNSSQLKDKTAFQILTSENAFHIDVVKQLHNLGIKWLDLNLGCPSKTVVKNQGGSFILKKPLLLKKIIRDIRTNFDGFFSAKIRIGFADDSLFLTNLKILEDEGVDAITLHARTREQLYKGKADWKYIKLAVENTNIPIIANGDIWHPNDIEQCRALTNCHSVMIARGALKTPWLAYLHKEKIVLTKKEHFEYILEYFQTLYKNMTTLDRRNDKILSSFKGLSRYLFEDLKDGQEFKSQILRSRSISALFELIVNKI